MALTPIVEELLLYIRKYDDFIANGKQFPSSREEDEDYVNTRQAIIDGSQRLRMAAMTVEQRLHQYMTKVSRCTQKSRHRLTDSQGLRRCCHEGSQRPRFGPACA